MPKQGQMEILGLAVIVVLILMGVLFAIQFVLKAPAAQIEQQYKESQLAAGLLTTMLGTTSDCRGASVTELLQDCAVFKSLECPHDDSCGEAGYAINTMLSGTLQQWRRAYRFRIKGAYNAEQIAASWGDCSGEIESNTNPVPTTVGTLQVTLDLCR
ncbi:hypothetical protein HY493_02250 [Candidatus Woesearchaeota archaeon]|nr:hypothetical protein [Candidatus Woesearchaeota archaeon]